MATMYLDPASHQHCWRRALTFSCGAMVLLASLVGAQGVALHGRVVDEGTPVAGATITIAAIGYSVGADSTGRFVLVGTPGGSITLVLRAPGYRIDTAAVVLPDRGVLDREFRLTRLDREPATSTFSSDVIRGTVIEPGGVPLSYANIQVNGGKRYLCDDSGRFVVPVNTSGAVTLLVRRIGFAPAELTFRSRPDSTLRIALEPVARELKGVVISGASAYPSLDTRGFYGRMRDAERGINHGYFVTPEDLDRRRPNYVTQMVENAPTVRVQRARDPKYEIIKGSLGCTMTVYLDGIRIVGRLGGRDDWVNQIVLPSHVAGLEIYPRAVSAPPQYQSLNGTCGVVLIWTK